MHCHLGGSKPDSDAKSQSSKPTDDYGEQSDVLHLRTVLIRYICFISTIYSSGVVNIVNLIEEH
jgi:hypothetical protein